jgi:hypothetical protein
MESETGITPALGKCRSLACEPHKERDLPSPGLDGLKASQLSLTASITFTALWAWLALRNRAHPARKAHARTDHLPRLRGSFP